MATASGRVCRLSQFVILVWHRVAKLRKGKTATEILTPKGPKRDASQPARTNMLGANIIVSSSARGMKLIGSSRDMLHSSWALLLCKCRIGYNFGFTVQ